MNEKQERDADVERSAKFAHVMAWIALIVVVVVAIVLWWVGR